MEMVRVLSWITRHLGDLSNIDEEYLRRTVLPLLSKEEQNLTLRVGLRRLVTLQKLRLISFQGYSNELHEEFSVLNVKMSEPALPMKESPKICHIEVGSGTLLPVRGELEIGLPTLGHVKFYIVEGLSSVLQTRLILGRIELATLGYSLGFDDEGSPAHILPGIGYIPFGVNFAAASHRGFEPYSVKLDDKFDYTKMVHPYHINESKLALYLQDQIQKGHIERWTSIDEHIALAPVFIVSSGLKERYVVDLRSINSHLIWTNLYTNTDVSDTIRRLKGHKWFGRLDLKAAFHQVPLTGTPIGIVTTLGVFRLKVLPFGLASSSMVFTMNLRRVLRLFAEKYPELTARVTIADYVDDLIVGAESEAETNHVLTLLSDFLVAEGLSLNAEKTTWACRSIEILGRVIADGKILVPPAQVSKIQAWNVPTTKGDIKSLLGTLNFFSHHVPDLGVLVHPFHEALQKKFVLTKEHLLKMEQSLTQIKQAFVEALRLTILDVEREAFVVTDASNTAIGGFVYQLGSDGLPQLISCFSRTLTSAEKNYSISERELLAVVCCVKAHKLLSLCPHVHCVVDHSALVYLDTKSDIAPRLRRLGYSLSVVPHSIHYSSGAKNPADWISRFGADVVASRQPRALLDDLSFHDPPEWYEAPPDTLLAVRTRASRRRDAEHGVEMGSPPLEEPTVESSSVPSSLGTDVSDPVSELPVPSELAENSPETAPPSAEGGASDAVVSDIVPVDNDVPTAPVNVPTDAVSADPPSDDVNEPSGLDSENIPSPDVEIPEVPDTVDQLQQEHFELIRVSFKNDTPLPPTWLKFIGKNLHIEESDDGSLLFLIKKGSALFRFVEDENEIRSWLKKEHDRFHGSPSLLLRSMDRAKLFHPHQSLLCRETVMVCERCEKFQNWNSLPLELQPLKIVDFGDLLHMDYVEMRTEDNDESRWCLHITEYTSGFVFGFPTMSCTAKHVLESIATVMTFLPTVTKIHADNASYFRSDELSHGLKQMFPHLKLGFASAYYPQGNGFVEKRNHLVKKILLGMSPNYEDWSRKLQSTLTLYNSMPNIDGYSPVFLCFGVNINQKQFEVISESDFGAYTREKQELEKDLPMVMSLALTDARQARLGDLAELRKSRSSARQAKDKVRTMRQVMANRYASHVDFVVGDLVLLKMPKKKKSDPAYQGPFMVSEVVGNGTYRLITLNLRRLKSTYNGSHLRIAYSLYGRPMKALSDVIETMYREEKKYVKGLLRRLDDIEVMASEREKTETS